MKLPTKRRRTPLEEAPVFRDLSAEQKREIEMAGSRRHVPKGGFVFHEGDPSSGLHVLLSGRLKSCRYLPGGQEIVMHLISAGELLGEVPAFLGKPYPVAARALEDSEVFTLPMSAMERVMSRQPVVVMRILRGMSYKLANLIDRIQLQQGKRGEERIARYLVSRLGTDQIRNGAVYALPVAKKVWATELGLLPESLSRSLRQLKESNVVAVTRRQIRILDALRLAELAGADRRRGRR
jgi:CRP/FNR family transcriptional regulator, dissimilatory nitrate respiration regulator